MRFEFARGAHQRESTPSLGINRACKVVKDKEVRKKKKCAIGTFESWKARSLRVAGSSVQKVERIVRYELAEFLEGGKSMWEGVRFWRLQSSR